MKIGVVIISMALSVNQASCLTVMTDCFIHFVPITRSVLLLNRSCTLVLVSAEGMCFVVNQENCVQIVLRSKMGSHVVKLNSIQVTKENCTHSIYATVTTVIPHCFLNIILMSESEQEYFPFF